MPPPLVLDTNAVLARGFPRFLRKYHGEKVLPAVAYAELGIHLCRARPPETYDRMLRDLGVEVEWLDVRMARNAMEFGLTQGKWDDLARDYLIGAHAASPPRLLVTNNVRDFDFLGTRVRTPAQLMASPPR